EFQNGLMGQSYPFVANGTDIVQFSDSNNDVGLTIDWDEFNNRFTYKAKGCGLDIFFVPFDSALKLKQKQMPGLSVAVSELNNPQFASNDHVMCLPPPAYNGGKMLKDIEDPFLTQEQSLLLRAFKSAQPQNQPHSDGGQCSATSSVLNSCLGDRQRQAINNCDWMFSRAGFLKCYDKTPGSKHILELFKM
ncbi:hypothetical protein PoB_000833600, partial [Plakobranchus ocellatus]